MAAATISEIYQDHCGNNGSPEISRQEIQAAIAKAVELRALHAALMQGNSPSSKFRFPASSCPPAPHYASQFSAQDYPVFTPSYEDEPLSGYHQLGLKSETLSETWGEFGIGVENMDESAISDYKKEKSSSRKGVASTISLESHICPAEDQKSVTGSCMNNNNGISTIQNSPRTDIYKSSRRNSIGDSKSISSCNQCKPAVITLASENKIAPLSNPNKSRRVFLARLFPKLKKKHKNNDSLSSPSEDVYVSVESLKKELVLATRCRDAALIEAAQMKCLLEELRQKLEYLETYCDGLKKAVKGNKLLNSDSENSMPVTEEVMTEGFLQIVAEARLSVNQFCKTLVGQVEETDSSLMDNLNVLLQPYKLSLNSRYSKLVLYHLEAIINQTLYQDFENCVFQKNGCPKILDPNQDRQAQFASFVALRNLSWNEVLRKGTKFYSEEFSKFCDQKMSCIITTLNWTRPWPEQLLQAFFVSAKCIWLLHLLAFSFTPTLPILRVEENRVFDVHYMEDMFADKHMSLGPSRVKVMVVPGFYVQGRVLRCRVLCKYKSSN